MGFLHCLHFVAFSLRGKYEDGVKQWLNFSLLFKTISTLIIKTVMKVSFSFSKIIAYN